MENKTRLVYFDHAAGKPVDPQVLEAMMVSFQQNYGNPSSLHSYGNAARKVIDEARMNLCELINADKKEEIIFTSGGTESNNLAIKGVAFRNKNKGTHIITSAIEHMSVINTCKYLSKQGYQITHLPVDKHGLIDLDTLRQEMTNQTILVSIMYANGEIGTIEPIKEIGKIVHEKGALFHVDAVAAAAQSEINVQEENIDLLSLSSNDMHGPKGVGALYLKTGTRIVPIIQGGGQERGLRSGTENIPGIVGMGKAAEVAKNEMKSENKRLSLLRDKLIKDIIDDIPESYLNGHPTERLPNNANTRFSYIEGESLILSLDMEGIACSSGSACTSKTLQPSHVLLSLGLKHEEAHGSLLFTLGKQNTEEDVTYLLDRLPNIITKLRTISPLTPKELMS
ncbi:MAG: cysteine desulfurase NifS [Candidatus Bathyarchaeota archaeon]|nr:MAG: cysteine desulfurase NifS [Candidatus Bathyarchaeota archaeon]